MSYYKNYNINPPKKHVSMCSLESLVEALSDSDKSEQDKSVMLEELKGIINNKLG